MVNYLCLDCNDQFKVSQRKSINIDGCRCGNCGGRLCRIGIDLAKGNDFSSINGNVIENK